MAILVAGGAGYIGSHFVLELRDHGEEVVVLDDLSTGHAWLVPHGIPLIRGDIADHACVSNLINTYAIDSIAHFAAKISVPDSVGDPLGYYLANTAKARALINTAVHAGVKQFLFSSTAAVYGAADIMPVTEETLPAPVSPYGRSKLMVEWMLEDAARAHGLSTMILRYFNVAGADPLGRSGQATENASHLIKVAAEAVIGKRDGMSIFGTDYPTPDGTCIRDYIHVSDLARAHRLALDYLREGGQSTVLNCAYGHGASVYDVIASVKRIAGFDFPVIIKPRRAGDPPEIVATGHKIRALLGWYPHYDDLDTIIAHALKWEQSLFEKRQQEARRSRAS